MKRELDFLMRRHRLIALAIIVAGLALTLTMATAPDGAERWDRAYVVMTGGLLAATAYYAVQTYETVAELRAQRAEAIEQRQESKREQSLSVRASVAGELRQIVEMIRVERGRGALLMNLPSEAWSASFAQPSAISEEARRELFEIYAEVERINALGRMGLAGLGTAADVAATGLERHNFGDFLASRIDTFLGSGALGPQHVVDVDKSGPGDLNPEASSPELLDNHESGPLERTKV